jgi:hypothetical protein
MAAHGAARSACQVVLEQRRVDVQRHSGVLMPEHPMHVLDGRSGRDGQASLPGDPVRLRLRKSNSGA